MNCYVSLLRGLLSGRLLSRGVEETLNHYSDGLIAKFYTREELERLFDPYFDLIKTYIFGQKNELVLIPGRGTLGKFKASLTHAIPDSWAFTILARVGGLIFLTSQRKK